jgi:hypothetical protein
MSSEINGPIISAISGFLAVLVGTAVIPSIRSYFSRRQAARYLAIRVVCTLDKYVDDCAMVATDWGRENQEGASEPQVSAPPVPSYPNDLDWHSIDYSLMYKILSLPTIAEKVLGIVSNASEHAYPPDYREYFEARNFQYATLGLKAFEVTVKLREKYRIPDQDPTEWDPVSCLREEIQDIKNLQEKRRSRFNELLSATPPLPT